jgi:hypothetical protein
LNQRAFIEDEIQSAVFCPPPAFSLRERKRKGRKAEGIRFERKAQAYLETLDDFYLPSPWILFISGGRPHWCQPDGIHFDLVRGVLTIIEIKYAHTAEAHRQLRRVYAPVLARLFPHRLWTYRLVEFVKWYDPATAFPEPVDLCPRPLAHLTDRIGVHIWRP